MKCPRPNARLKQTNEKKGRSKIYVPPKNQEPHHANFLKNPEPELCCVAAGMVASRSKVPRAQRAPPPTPRAQQAHDNALTGPTRARQSQGSLYGSLLLLSLSPSDTTSKYTKQIQTACRTDGGSHTFSSMVLFCHYLHQIKHQNDSRVLWFSYAFFYHNLHQIQHLKYTSVGV